MIPIQHILVQYLNGGFNVIKVHYHLNSQTYFDGNVELLYSNQMMLI
jgi:hypothetical protein